MSGEAPIRVKDVMTQDYQTVDGIMTVKDGVCRMRDTGAVARAMTRFDPGPGWRAVSP